jgi:molybdopterin-biosynthesis enzyme MoeA-like protein
MLEWVLQTYYTHLFRSVAEFDRSMIVLDLFEAAVTPLMQTIAQKYPQFKIYSLPSAGEAGLPRHIELGLKASGRQDESSPPEAFEQAYLEFRAGVTALGGQITEERQDRR